MDKQSPPQSMGVFSPVGHVVISFSQADAMDAAAAELAQHGWQHEQLTRYPPEQMKAQADHDLAHASPAAALGQDINLVRAHRQLAEKGYSFLVVPAKNDEQAQEIVTVAQAFHAERAQHYGRFVIEELIEQRADEAQTFESPDRGLDAQTRSGKEKERSAR